MNDTSIFNRANTIETNLYYSGHRIANDEERIKRDYSYKENKANTAKILKTIIIILLFVIFLQLIYHLYFARNLVIKTIEVNVDKVLTLSNDMILEMAGIESEKPYFSIDPLEIKRRLEMYPQIFHAEVEKTFPDKLKISLSGRSPLAICLIENQQRTIPMILDSQGVIFQIGNEALELDLPIISGIKFSDARIGAVMPQTIVDFLQSLAELRNNSFVFYNNISELNILKKTNDNFDVLMYLNDNNTPIRMGERLTKEKMAYVFLILDTLKEQNIEKNFQELDFRTDKIIYKVKEGEPND